MKRIRQKQIARKIGVSEGLWSDYIHGHRGLGAKNQARICDAFGVDANWLRENWQDREAVMIVINARFNMV